jgi:type I restriction enzyme S subunit
MIDKYQYIESTVDWIGDIPVDWKLVRGRFLFNRKKEINHDLRCTNLLSLTLFGVLNKSYDSNDGLRPQTYETYQVFERDDLVFKMIDLENVRTSRVGIVHERGIMSPVYLRHKPIKEKIYSKFAYWFYYDLYKKEIFNYIGSGVRSSLSSSDLLELQLPLPSPNEQQLISRYLDKKTAQIDSLIEKIEKKIELLKEQRTSLINQCVTKGLDPNVEMKDSGVEWIGKIPKHWSVVKIKNLTKPDGFRSGPFGSALITSELAPCGDWIVYSPEHLRSELVDDQLYVPEKRLEELQKYLVKPSDIILPIVGSLNVAKVILETDPIGIINQRLCRLTLDDHKVVIPYVAFIFVLANVIRVQIQLEKKGSILDHITKEIIFNIRFPLPSEIAEQQLLFKSITDINDRTEQRVKKHHEQISLLNEYRQSLISSVVTGKIRITEDMV